MTKASKAGPPRKILVASDLSARCDRAFDRAVQLASQWGAEIRLVHAVERHIEPPDAMRQRMDDARSTIEREFREERGDRPVQLVADVVERAPAEAVLDAARVNAADLIVMAPARYDTLGEIVLGSNVERALRHAEQPVLVVKDRPRRPYAKICVCVDLSEPSRRALDCAFAFFPEAEVTVLHAYTVPFESFLYSEAARQAVARRNEKEIAALLSEEVERFVDPARRQRPLTRIALEYGPPQSVVHAHVREEHPQLVVLGTHGHTGFRRAVLGSVAEWIINSLPCDILAVRPAPTP